MLTCSGAPRASNLATFSRRTDPPRPQEKGHRTEKQPNLGTLKVVVTDHDNHPRVLRDRQNQSPTHGSAPTASPGPRTRAARATGPTVRRTSAVDAIAMASKARSTRPDVHERISCVQMRSTVRLTDPLEGPAPGSGSC